MIIQLLMPFTFSKVKKKSMKGKGVGNTPVYLAFPDGVHKGEFCSVEICLIIGHDVAQQRKG